MKKIIYLFSVTVSLFAFCACDDYDFKEKVQTLYVVESHLNFTASAGTGTIVTQSEKGGITAQSNMDWCTVAVSGMTVNVSVTANPDFINRTALITITSGDESTVVPVTQASTLFILEGFDSNVPWDGISAELNVQSDLPVAVSADQHWITARITDNVLSVTVQANEGNTTRNGVIAVTSGDLTQEIPIRQARFEMYAMLLGDWTLRCKSTSGADIAVTLTFTQRVAETAYNVSGFFPQATVTATFDNSTGTLTFTGGQYIGINGSYDVYFIGRSDTNTVTTGAVVYQGNWNQDRVKPEYTFSDIGSWPGYTVSGFVCAGFSGGNYVGTFTDYTYVGEWTLTRN